MNYTKYYAFQYKSFDVQRSRDIWASFTDSMDSCNEQI